MNRTMNEDTAENRDCSNDTDHVKKDKGAYAEPLPESFRPRRDGPGGEEGFKREKSQTDKRLPALAACVSCLGFFTFYSGYRFYILAQTYYFTYLI